MTHPPHPLRHLLAAYRWPLAGIALFSGVANILMLTGAFFMLQVYDRVLPSRSVETLVALAILAAGLFFAYGLLDMIRHRLMTRIAAAFDLSTGDTIFAAILQAPLRRGSAGAGQAPGHLRDLETVRAFLTSQGPIALFDLPWLPIYLAVIFSFHPALGWMAVFGVVVLVAIALTTELLLRRPTRAQATTAQTRHLLAQEGQRNAEAIHALGMAPALAGRWQEMSRAFVGASQSTSDIASGFGALSRALRMILQSAMLGLGAYLVIYGQATAGIIIAGSILAARALAPIDLALANWRGLTAARLSLSRISAMIAQEAAPATSVALPAPCRSLAVKQAAAIAPETRTPTIAGIAFNLSAGDGLGIIGPSGSGKSSLARVITGAWPCARGRVELDGAALDQWAPASLGRHIGYLPQDLELFAGTIGDNIARFDPGASSKAIIAAATAAGAHAMITALPDGYDTPLGQSGQGLSAGQRQRIALARALYGDPFLLVLDEPNSNLDGDGEAALNSAIQAARARGAIVIIIAHRRSALAAVDKLLVLQEGRQTAFGDRDSILAGKLRAVASSSAHPNSVHPNTTPKPNQPGVAVRAAS